MTRFLPPTPLARRLAIQSMLYALGDGTFFTSSAVFFTQIVGISAAQVGLGLSAAMAASFVLSVPLGKLADRVGPKRLWTVAGFAGAALYAAWPLVGGFAAFLFVVIALEAVGTAGRAGRGAYAIDALPREERVRSMAFMRAALNVGFTLGALLGGVALALNSDDIVRSLPWVTAVILTVNAISISRMPKATHERSAEPAGQRPGLRGLRNRGFVALFAFDGVLNTNQVLLNVVIPLWLVEKTDAPRVLLAWLFATNTVMAVLLQVPVARGVDTVDACLRASRRSGVFFVISCGIVLVTHDTIGWITIVLIWLGHVTLTGAELFQSAGHWGFLSELSDPDRLGEYQGVAQLGGNLGGVWAPAVYTYLALEWGGGGWIVIAAAAAVATVAMHPSARAAERFLSTRSAATAPSVAPKD